MSSRRLSDLTPDTRALVEKWLAACAARDVGILVYCTLRTAREQAKLYESGRTTVGPILTHAPAWQSWHQFGRALDAVPNVHGKCLWEYRDNSYGWQVFVQEAEAAGLEWGGRWTRFQDYIHLQFVPAGLTLPQRTTVATKPTRSRRDTRNAAQRFPRHGRSRVKGHPGIPLRNEILDEQTHIFLDSKVDQYTAVYLYWPFREEKEMGTRTAELTKEEKKSHVKPATVLVVDDEYNIRSMMKEIMEMSGLKVFTAGDGRAGVDIYQQHKKEIDLIIMDMVMPIMDGRAAFNEIRKINPKQKRFIISGYSQREDLEDILENGAVGFLRKPFQVKEIVEKVQEILNLKN